MISNHSFVGCGVLLGANDNTGEWESLPEEITLDWAKRSIVFLTQEECDKIPRDTGLFFTF